MVPVVSARKARPSECSSLMFSTGPEPKVSVAALSEMTFKAAGKVIPSFRSVPFHKPAAAPLITNSVRGGWPFSSRVFQVERRMRSNSDAGDAISPPKAFLPEDTAAAHEGEGDPGRLTACDPLADSPSNVPHQLCGDIGRHRLSTGASQPRTVHHTRH